MTRTAPPPMPSEGGSYVLEKDGTLRRTEWTRQPGDPGSGSGAGPEPVPIEPKAGAKAATAETVRKATPDPRVKPEGRPGLEE